jgi:alkyldihydroxyacetonephosphate synthase
MLALRADQISTRPIERRAVATDQWPRALLASRNGELAPGPRMVVSPESAEDVERVVAYARSERMPIVPYGLGSGVVGGGSGHGITLDLKRMRQVLELQGATVRVQAGMVGIHLEQYLRQRGYTLGHFPSSIICSSVGGWLAGRSAGQFSSRYGKIEDMALSLRAVCGDAVTHTFAEAELPLIIGSEGTFGAIVDAELAVWPAPEAEHYWGFTVRGVRHGLDIMEKLLALGFAPSVVRLYDEYDSRAAKDKVASHSPEWLRALKQRSLAAALTFPSLMRLATDALPEACTLILGSEGGERIARVMMEGMREAAVSLGATDLGPGPGQAWYHGRYHVSYKQSPIFILGGYVDTMEVSAPWPVVARVYDRVRDALRDHAFVMAHFSHAYLDGCALYFTFAARATGDELEHYDETWRLALAAATAEGASVSHHHGVGRAKSAMLRAHHGPLWREYAALKRRFDPDDVFNPGLFDE